MIEFGNNMNSIELMRFARSVIRKHGDTVPVI